MTKAGEDLIIILLVITFALSIMIGMTLSESLPISNSSTVNLNGCGSHRAAICDYDPRFLVTAYSWPTFLYENGRYDLNCPTNGLFKSRLLVKVCQGIPLSSP